MCRGRTKVYILTNGPVDLNSCSYIKVFNLMWWLSWFSKHYSLSRSAATWGRIMLRNGLRRMMCSNCFKFCMKLRVAEICKLSNNSRGKMCYLRCMCRVWLYGLTIYRNVDLWEVLTQTTKWKFDKTSCEWPNSSDIQNRQFVLDMFFLACTWENESTEISDPKSVTLGSTHLHWTPTYERCVVRARI